MQIEIREKYAYLPAGTAITFLSLVSASMRITRALRHPCLRFRNVICSTCPYVNCKSYSTSPYFTLILSSFSSIGFEMTARIVTVATAWMRSIGSPCRYTARNIDSVGAPW